MLKSKARDVVRKLRTYQVLIGIIVAVSIGGVAFVAKPMIVYELCVRDDNVIWTSYPSKCLTATGRMVTNPRLNEKIERIIESVRF